MIERVREKYGYDCEKISILPVSLSIGLHDIPKVQFELGRYDYNRGESLLDSILNSIFYLHPHHIIGYLYEKRKHSYV